MPLDIIMDDLRHTHSLEVTIDNILQGNIAVPSVSTPKKEIHVDEQGLNVCEISLLMLCLSLSSENESKCVKGRVSRFCACLYYLFACAHFLAQAQFVIVYEPILSKLPNFLCK